METKSLLYGLIGFFIGGLLVAIAANTFDKAELQEHTSMTSTASLDQKVGDDYDKAYLEVMIDHHQAAIVMAQTAQSNAKHPEIKQLSKDIIMAQQKEINDMKAWQVSWDYQPHPNMMH